MTNEIKGVITALVTPFNNGEIDFPSFRRLIRAQLDQGVDGFVINGTTGESPCLEFGEVERLFETARHEVAGQVPLILGTGFNSTKKTVEFTRTTSGWGPDAVLVVVPYYNKPPQRGLLAHFRAVAEASTAPVLLYNVPSRTVASLDAETVAQLAKEERIVGLKDATGDLAELTRLVEVTNGFTLLSGDDGTCVDFAARGGHGVISVASHVIPREMKRALDAARTGDAAAHPEFDAKFGALIRALFVEANPIPLKMALHWMGLIDSPELRLPLTALDERYHEELRNCLRNLAKI